MKMKVLGVSKKTILEGTLPVIYQKVTMNKFKAVLLAGAFAFIGDQESRATLLNLIPPALSPDFMAGVMTVSYTPNYYAPGSGLFQASGSTVDYVNGSVPLLGGGAYTLSATITSAGMLTSGGLTIQGDVGFGVETLLTGSLNTGSSGTAFGFNNAGGNLFEFLFTLTGGKPSIVADFGGLGTPNGGVIIDAWFGGGDVPFNGTWTSAFHNNGTGNALADNFATVPEPTSGCLLGVGIVAWAMTLRHSNRRRASVTR